MLCCLLILDPKEYFNKTDAELRHHAKKEIKFVCNTYSRSRRIGIKTFPGLLDLNKVLLQFELIKPKIARSAIRFHDITSINPRISMFWHYCGPKYFDTYSEFGRLIEILMIEAAQTDDNERVNFKRKKWANEHNLVNLEKLSTVLKLKMNGDNPYVPSVLNLYLKALDAFNKQKRRLYSAAVPSEQR
eukprot:79186_1